MPNELRNHEYEMKLNNRIQRSQTLLSRVIQQNKDVGNLGVDRVYFVVVNIN